jgi:hypothetical protein
VIVNGLWELVDLGELEEASIASDDTLEAVVSAVVPWMAASGRTVAPDSEADESLAAVEGWIHLPHSPP